jgi:hypothetical protein
VMETSMYKGQLIPWLILTGNELVEIVRFHG